VGAFIAPMNYIFVKKGSPLPGWGGNYIAIIGFWAISAPNNVFKGVLYTS